MGTLHVEGCVISGFSTFGILVNLTADLSHIFIKDTIVRNNGNTGIQIQTSTGKVSASIDNCRLERNTLFGFSAYINSRVTINRSVASGNSNCGFIASSSGSGATAELSCEECVASNNGDGFRVATDSGSSATIRVSHSTATNNTSFGFLHEGGVFESLKNNLVAGNNGGGAQTAGTITVITAE